MGKAFIIVGLWIKVLWSKVQCKWNSLLRYISFNKIEKCQKKSCTCNI